MQQVFNNSMVAHTWAQQSQGHGRNSNGSFYFNDRTIYSYGSHFPIATFVKPDLVLINSASYSVTTGCQQSQVRRSIPGFVKQLSAPICEPHQAIDHATNLKWLREQMEQSLIKAGRARTYKDMHLRDAESYRYQYNNYLIELNIKRKSINELPDSGELVTKANNATANERKRRARLAAKVLRDNEENIELWKNGESYVNGIRSVSTVFLRIKDNAIQTSHGAEFPVDHARRAYPLIKAIRARGEAWRRNGENIRLGHFQLDSIDKKGNIIAGCHRVQWDEISRIGELLIAG